MPKMPRKSKDVVVVDVPTLIINRLGGMSSPVVRFAVEIPPPPSEENPYAITPDDRRFFPFMERLARALETSGIAGFDVQVLATRSWVPQGRADGSWWFDQWDIRITRGTESATFGLGATLQFPEVTLNDLRGRGWIA